MAFKQTYQPKLPRYTVKKKNEQYTGIKIKQPVVPQNAPAAMKIKQPDIPRQQPRAAISAGMPKQPIAPAKISQPKAEPTAPKTAVVKPPTTNAATHGKVKINLPSQAAKKNHPVIKPANPTLPMRGGSIQIPQMPVAIPRSIVKNHPVVIDPVMRDAADVQRYYLEQAAYAAWRDDTNNRANYDSVANYVRRYNDQRIEPSLVLDDQGRPRDYEGRQQNRRSDLATNLQALAFSSALGGIAEAVRGRNVSAFGQGALDVAGEAVAEYLKSQIPEKFRDIVTFENLTHPRILGQNLAKNLPNWEMFKKKYPSLLEKTFTEIMDDLGVSTDNFSKLDKTYRRQRQNKWQSLPATDRENVAKYVALDRLGENLLGNIFDAPGVYQIDRDILRQRWQDSLQSTFDPETRKIVSELRNIGVGTGNIVPAIDTTTVQRPTIVPAPNLRTGDVIGVFNAQPNPSVKWAEKKVNKDIDQAKGEEYDAAQKALDIYQSRLKGLNDKIDNYADHIANLSKSISDYFNAKHTSLGVYDSGGQAAAQMQKEWYRLQQLEGEQKDMLAEVSTLQKKILDEKKRIFDLEILQRMDNSKADSQHRNEYRDSADEFYKKYTENRNKIRDNEKKKQLAEITRSKLQIERSQLGLKFEQDNSGLIDAYKKAESEYSLLSDETEYRKFWLPQRDKIDYDYLKDKIKRRYATLKEKYDEKYKPIEAKMKEYDPKIKTLTEDIEGFDKEIVNAEKEKDDLQNDFAKKGTELLGNKQEKIRILREIMSHSQTGANNNADDEFWKLIEEAKQYIPADEHGGEMAGRDLGNDVGGIMRGLGGIVAAGAGTFALAKLANYIAEQQKDGGYGGLTIPIGREPREQNIKDLSNYLNFEEIQKASDIDLRLALQKYLAKPPKSWRERTVDQVKETVGGWWDGLTNLIGNLGNDQHLNRMPLPSNKQSDNLRTTYSEITGNVANIESELPEINNRNMAEEEEDLKDGENLNRSNISDYANNQVAVKTSSFKKKFNIPEPQTKLQKFGGKIKQVAVKQLDNWGFGKPKNDGTGGEQLLRVDPAMITDMNTGTNPVVNIPPIPQHHVTKEEIERQMQLRKPLLPKEQNKEPNKEQNKEQKKENTGMFSWIRKQLFGDK